jgi:hypothetical protein
VKSCDYHEVLEPINLTNLTPKLRWMKHLNPTTNAKRQPAVETGFDPRWSFCQVMTFSSKMLADFEILPGIWRYLTWEACSQKISQVLSPEFWKGAVNICEWHQCS